MSQKRRMLIINDSMNLETDKMFQGSGVDAEVKMARDMAEGIVQLDAWAKDGHPADIVTIDCHKKIGENVFDTLFVGWQYQDQLDEWSEKQAELVRPKKVFWHSAIEVRHPDNVGFHYMEELSNIARLGERNYSFVHMYGDAPLTEFVNGEWGTNLPTNAAQVRELSIQAGVLSPYGLQRDVEKGDYTEFQALKGLEIESINLKPYLDTRKYPTGSEWFEFAAPGVARGSLAFDEDDVHNLRAKGKDVILAVNQLEPQHMRLLPEIAGVVVLGKGTQHAKYVFEAHGKAAQFNNSEGLLEIKDIDGKKHLCRKDDPANEKTGYQLKVGTEISMDGWNFFHKKLPVVKGDIKDYEKAIADWADRTCKVEHGIAVKANADTAEQVKESIKRGATGIGLVRTEHMFFSPEMHPVLQEVLSSPNDAAIQRFKGVQQGQFEQIFRAAKEKNNFPITIRLLDAPPEEFLEPPALAKFINKAGEENARGARFALKTPGLYAAQAEAIFDAATAADYKSQVEIMIPLIYSAQELQEVKQEIDSVAAAKGYQGRFRFGAMIETTEAIHHAGEIAQSCDFVSFGTNDLTSEITGSRRNDIETTQAWMTAHNIPVSPFITLAPQVADAMRQAIGAAKAAKPDIQVGICGDQVSGNYASIKLCGDIGLDSISVQPTNAAIVESRIMAGKVCASGLPAEKLTRRLEEVEAEAGISPRRSFASRRPKRDPFESDGTGWGKGKKE